MSTSVGQVAKTLLRHFWVRRIRHTPNRALSTQTSTSTTSAAAAEAFAHVDSLSPRLLNVTTGTLEPLLVSQSCITKPLKWYSCGPTVYDSAHLGHARTYVCLDVVRRIMTDFFRIDVTYALGITDVDDKIITKARTKGLTKWPAIAEMAQEYEVEFMKDMSDLGVGRPDVLCRVTDHIPEIIDYIQHILENDMAYEAKGGIFFDVERMGSSYGKLGIKGMEQTVEGGNQSSDGGLGKRSPRDFALWKRAKDGEPSWESPFGRGRPGWHIECSAMTHTLFGTSLDIHSGGIDLKFPHHTNEIAQCDAYRCCVGGSSEKDSEPWVKHWLHTGHLHIEGLKMSKSLKNFITVREYLDQHPDGSVAAAEDFRLFCLLHKYGSSVTFSTDRVQEASVLRSRFVRLLSRAATLSRKVRPSRRRGDEGTQLGNHLSQCRAEVRLAFCNDFDTPSVIRSLSNLCAAVTRYLDADLGEDSGPVLCASKYIAEMLALLGANGTAAIYNEDGLAARGTSPNSITGLGPPVTEAIDAMVDLRRDVRAKVLAFKSGETASLEDAKAMKREVLQLLDDARNRRFKAFGVEVTDGPNLTSKWAYMPHVGQQHLPKEEHLIDGDNQ